MRHHLLQRLPFLAGLAAAAVLLTTCSNGIDIVEAVKTEVMVANEKFLLINAVNPENLEDEINPWAPLTIEFDRAVDMATVNETTVLLRDPSNNPMDWTANFNAPTRTLTITPAALDGPVTYTAMITSGVKGTDGSSLQQSYAWSFTTLEAPAGTVTVDLDRNGAGEEYTNDDSAIAVTLTFNAMAAQYRLCAVAGLETAPAGWGTWHAQADAGTQTINLSSTDGPWRVYVQFANLGGGVTSPIDALSDTIILDTTDPVVDAGTLDWLNAATPARAVAATASDATSGVDSYAWTGAGITFSNAAILNPTVSATADNTYTATLTVTDKAGNSASDTVSVRRDVTPPSVSTGTLDWLSIANPSRAANATTSDPGSNPSGIATRAWTGTGISFSNAALEDPTISASTDGTRTATLTVTDTAGNQAAATLAVRRDATVPTVSSLYIGSTSNPAYTTSATVNLYQTATDATSGVSQMQFLNDGGAWSALQAYATSRSGWTLNSAQGTRTVTVRVTDAAGNTSSTRADTIVLDSVAPAVSVFTIGSGNPSNTNTAATTLYITASDATSGLKESRYGNLGESYTAWESTTAASWTRAWTLTDSKGTRTVYLQVRDNAGNAAQITDSITLNARIVVTYSSLYISDDSDLIGSGEIYYAFLIDGVQKLVRTEANAVAIASPATFTGKGTGLPASFTIYEDPTSGSFTMTGGVADDDGASDDVGTMTPATYNAPFADDTGETRPISGDVAGSINYAIDVQN